VGGIVVGVDGSAQSERALRLGLEEARLRGVPLEVVHVWEAPPLGAISAGYAPGLGPMPVDMADYSETLEAVEEAAQTVPDRMVEALSAEAEGVDVRIRAVQGSPADVLADISRDADLVCVGTQGHGRVAELVMGSVTRDLIHRAHCPVLVVPAAGQSDSE
jgi:nucleotide-binding universal stress UspA family protein